ncbi:MAG: hypothetical protein NZ693_03140, partial [Thermoflexales bacterium]|nr:hypothetical protein [Thermoflexales bacterium]
PTPTRAELPVVVVQPSATPEPAPAEPAISETRVPTEAQPAAHPAVQTIRDANEELVALFTGRKDAAALQPLWMPSALDLLIGFATVRLPRAMRVSADQRDTIQASYEYLRAPALVDERGNTAVVTSREYWQFSTTVNNVVICETRDYTYTLVVEGDGYRIRTFSGRLLSTRCR